MDKALSICIFSFLSGKLVEELLLGYMENTCLTLIDFYPTFCQSAVPFTFQQVMIESF